MAAGVVVWRPGRKVLLVHRPRYDDWSLPKGKLDPGEAPQAAAVREVLEETGVRVRLGPALEDQHYPVAAGRKTVHYWVGWAVGDDDVSAYEPNAEIDGVAWVPDDEAAARLSHARDRATLVEAGRLRGRTRALVVLRHAEALPRRDWEGEDRDRPLGRLGRDQAQRLAPVLDGWDVTRVVTSSSTRCVQTVEAYAKTRGHRLEVTEVLSEEDATGHAVADLVADLLADRANAVVCTHRPVLPAVLDAAGVAQESLQPGGALVVHHRKRKAVAVELWPAPGTGL